MTDHKKQALLEWLSKVLNTDIQDLSQLRDGKLLTELCNKIPGINLKTSPNYQGWKDGYMRLKTLHEEISSFMKNAIKYEFPNAVETINLVEMAKGHDDEGLASILNMIFLVSFNLGPEDSQVFVQKAMMVSPQNQEQLYEILRSNPVPKDTSQAKEQFEQKYEKQRQKVTSLIQALQSLSSQNQSLRQTLLTETQQTRKIHEQLKKAEQEKQKLKKQLIQNYKLQQQEEPTKHNMHQHHEQMIEMLKNSMLQQEQSYSQQIFELKQKIQSLEQQLNIFQNKINQLEDHNNNQRNQQDHSNCVNINLYKKEKTQLTNKLTQASAKEWKTKLQNIRLQNLAEQLKEKNKKLSEQNKNNQNNSLISKNDANKLKLQFYTQIRDKLKKKIQVNDLLNNQSKKKQSQQNVAMIIGNDI